MPKLEELQDISDRFKHWVGFWQNIVITILVGLATLAYAYIKNEINTEQIVTLSIILLLFLLFIVTIIIMLAKKQNKISEQIRRERR